MRAMIMHKTNAHWESGAAPTPELVQRVGQMIGEFAQAGTLLAAEGLRASSQGVRLTFSRGRRSIKPGPFEGADELPAAFAILQVADLDAAILWGTRLGRALRSVELDIRPVTEPWDIGMGEPPPNLGTRRFMLLHKATRESESGTPLTADQHGRIAGLRREMEQAGVLQSLERFQPSATGLRLKVEKGRPVTYDGPFIETKELLAGFVILRVDSMAEIRPLVHRYADTVGAHEVDCMLLAEPSAAHP